MCSTSCRSIKVAWPVGKAGVLQLGKPWFKHRWRISCFIYHCFIEEFRPKLMSTAHYLHNQTHLSHVRYCVLSSKQHCPVVEQQSGNSVDPSSHLSADLYFLYRRFVEVVIMIYKLNNYIQSISFNLYRFSQCFRGDQCKHWQSRSKDPVFCQKPSYFHYTKQL